MGITKETVQHVAHLARIQIQDKELEKLALQLKDILNFIDKLKELKIEGIAPTSHILPVNNVLREDTPKESLLVKKVLENACGEKENFFTVPKVIE